MKRCPKCHAEFGDGATFCEYCGAKLVKPCVCPHCGEEVSDDAAFCLKCGKPINEVVSAVEVHKDEAKIEQYKRELVSLRSKKISMLIIGACLLAIGLTMFIVFIALIVKTSINNPGLLGKYYLYMFLAVFGALILDAGVALMIVAGAVFSRKISNRERAIRESEKR